MSPRSRSGTSRKLPLTRYSEITILRWVAEYPLKRVVWTGSSRRDLREFPDGVQDHIGYALYVAQQGGQHRDAKTLRGFGSGDVVEIIKDFRGDTFRAVYTVRFGDTIYVLHAFQKKSKTGRETPRRDIELINRRLREAVQIAKQEKL